MPLARGLNRVLGGFTGVLGLGIVASLAAGTVFAAPRESDASLQITWESPTATTPQVLGDFTLEELSHKKSATLTEVDPLAKGVKEKVKFSGLSLAALIDETTKGLSAADRATTDLVVLKTRSGKEVPMPKAFLVKYPQIQLALKRNGQPLGAEAPRVVLPTTSNSKIGSENIFLQPLFVSELATITLTSYEKRYGAFLLKRRTDPAAMRGEKLFLQNCVSCHSDPQNTLSSLASAQKIEGISKGLHPDVAGLSEFMSLFDKRATRSLASYLEAYRFQTAKN